MNAIFSAYSRIASKDIEKAIKKEMSGDLEKACLAIGHFLLLKRNSNVLAKTIICFFFIFIVKSAKSKSAYYTEMLHEAMAGLGTHDEDLIRLIVSRSEVNFIRHSLHFKM